MRHSFVLFVIIFFLTCQKSEAQYNYVPNPSFEEYDSLTFFAPDSTIHYYYYSTHWFLPVSCWYCSYFNSKLNFIDTTGGMGISQYGVPQNPWSYTYPYDGIAQSAFCPFTVSLNEGLRNYLEVKLKIPLIQGHKYCVSFFVTLADSAYIAVDQIGAIFTDDTLKHFNPYGDPPCYLLQIPQVVGPPEIFLAARNQWQNISGTFTAQGGEQFLTIGNFKTDSNTNYIWVPNISTYGPGSYYHIDMVSVIECDSSIRSAFAGKDTSICLGDSIRLGICDSLFGYSFLWTPIGSLDDSTTMCPYAKPTETTTYTLQQWYYNSYLTTDEVMVTVIDCNQPEQKNNIIYVPNIFSPNKDGQNDKLYVRGQEIESLHFYIYNRWGNLVFDSKDINQGWDGTQNGKPCETGVYVYRAEVTFKNGETVVKRGDVTLVR